jgi:hypothetical protein
MESSRVTLLARLSRLMTDGKYLAGPWPALVPPSVPVPMVLAGLALAGLVPLVPL